MHGCTINAPAPVDPRTCFHLWPHDDVIDNDCHDIMRSAFDHATYKRDNDALADERGTRMLSLNARHTNAAIYDRHDIVTSAFDHA